MTIVFILLVSAAALELCLYAIRPLWKVKRALASVVLLVTAFASGSLVTWHLNLFTVVILLVSLYRIFNLIRIAENRMHEKRLYHVTRHTSLALLGMQALVFGGWWAWDTWHGTGHGVWTAATALQLAVAAGLLVSVVRNMRRMRWPARNTNYTDSELPSITVAIPARNETDDLQECLHSLIASDYPKLEIIVLDDCSQLKRTPEIIRGFAHDGVRFIQGTEPSESWLPKNQAYDRLVQEASGAYILFCGVDVRFGVHTLREVVSLMLDRNKEMISMLPRRQRDAYGHLSLVQAMRYWWELLPPRRLFNRPPVLSSAWVIKTSTLQRLGGFGAVARSIAPEAYFARALTTSDGYSFLLANSDVALSSNKQVGEQRDTALRTRYPQLHRRPEQVALVAMLEAYFLLLPFGLAIAGFWVSIGVAAQVLAALASLVLILAYRVVVLRTHVNSQAFSIIGQPLMIGADILLMHYSMWKYEFSTVEWKGRNVCIPVMHVIPHLPKID